MKKCLTIIILISLCVLSSIIGCSDSKDENIISLFRWDFDITEDENDEIGNHIKDKFGIKIKSMSAPWTNWFDRLNTMIASGSVPDMFIGYGIMDVETYVKWIDDEIILPVSDYVNDNYPNLKEYLSKWDKQKINGKLYSIPVESYVDHVLWVRSDWLEELNMTPPQTMEDFYDVAVAFKNKYNIYPFSSSAPHTAGIFWMNMFFYAYGSSWNDWDELEDGSYIPSWISDGAKKAVKFIKKLYDEGLLDPDFVTDSDSIKKEKFATGKIGMMMHGEYELIRNTMQEVNPKAEYIILPPVKGPSGQGMWGLDGYFSALMINAKLEENKRNKILKLLDYLHSDEGIEMMCYGIEGVHYKTENGKKMSLIHKDNTKNKTLLTDVSSYSKLRFLRALEWRWIPEWDKGYEQMKYVIELCMNFSKAEKFPYIVTKTKVEVGRQLEDFRQAEYIKLITQSKNFDEDWDNFVKEYKKRGGDKLIKEMNDEIKEQQ